MKKLCFILLLLFSSLNVWASTVYTYPASADDLNTTGLKVEFNGEIATVTLYKSGALGLNYWLWNPADGINAGNVQALSEWPNVKYIYFVSENGEEYNQNDWLKLQSLINKPATTNELSLDFSAMIIDDDLFKITSQKVNYIKMPNSLVNLTDYAFLQCENLSAIGWSPALKSIGKGAFESTAFESITVPEGVESIGDQAFSQNHNLTSVSLPSTLKTIGVDIVDGSENVIAIHSHNKKAPIAQGDICDNTGWSFSNNEFSFYNKCILYIQPNEETFKSYCSSRYWCKFFVTGAAKICLHTYDLNRPLVKGVQRLKVVQPNVQPEDPEEMYIPHVQEESQEDGLTVVEIAGFPPDFYTIHPINTVYQRDMSEIKWYSIMLPFDVDDETVKNVFSKSPNSQEIEKTRIMGYSGIHDYTLCFEKATEKIEEDIPYLIKPGVGKSEYEFDGLKISYSEYLEYPKDAEHPELVVKPTEIGVPGADLSYNQYASEFVGTYCNQQIPVDAYYLKNNVFYYMPKENTQKGWKAYSGVVIINPEANGSAAARPSATYLDINLDSDMPTGIDSPTSVAIGSQSLDGPIYTLSGQQVKNPGKGIYIRNGKKFIIK